MIWVAAFARTWVFNGFPRSGERGYDLTSRLCKDHTSHSMNINRRSFKPATVILFLATVVFAPAFGRCEEQAGRTPPTVSAEAVRVLNAQAVVNRPDDA